MKKTICCIALFALSACAEATNAVNDGVTPAKLQTDTAVYFATSTKNVRVANLKGSVVGTQYQAKVAGTVYDCKYFRGTVSCVRA